MKKHHILTLALVWSLVLIAPVCLSALADEPKTHRTPLLTYIINDDGTLTITDCDMAVSGDYALPSEIKGREVVALADNSFDYAYDLDSLTIPDSVVRMGSGNPFVHCQLNRIQVSAGHPVYATIEHVLFEKAGKTLITYPRKHVKEEYNIPQGILAIGDGAFARCAGLSAVEIPDSVTTIGNHAFFECKKLLGVNIPDSVISIGDSAFSNCKRLTALTIPATVTQIGENAFSNCPELVLTVTRGSCAEVYARENGLSYICTDALDWLNA